MLPDSLLTASPRRAARPTSTEPSRADHSPDMALSVRQSYAVPHSALSKDLAPSADSFAPSDRAPEDRSSHRRSSRSSLPLQYQRRSLYNLHELSAVGPLEGSAPTAEECVVADEGSLESPPDTPPTKVLPVDFNGNMERSAERQQYRSWRSGKAKMEGMTIAESQRRLSQPDALVENIIDAQLPQPDPNVANVRSRKASHYLGLFKENDADQRRNQSHDFAKRDASSTGAAEQHLTGLKESQFANTRDRNVAESDGKPRRPAKHLPLELLEDIKNHHHLAPTISRNVSVPKAVHGQDAHRVRHQDKKANDGESDSDRELISSATYFPHQGVIVGDSPVDESQPRRPDPRAVDAKDPPASKATEDVQIALRSKDTSECLHGDLPVSKSQTFDTKRSLPTAQVHHPSDSEYESGYSSTGYESLVSDEEQASDVTPTGTPTGTLTSIPDPTRRRRRHVQKHPVPPPAPIGAVELKPFRHQVGGHTTVYRFSRRAVCKKLNSKENMFYETVEQHHPELLGFMPRYVWNPGTISTHRPRNCRRSRR